MSEIKDGYGGKPTYIRVHASKGDNVASIWIEKIVSKSSDYDETLSYATIQELISLRNEINIAIKELSGI